MVITKEWEMFYTDSKKDEDNVDQISIDTRNKRFVLDIDADMMVTDGYFEDGETEVVSWYISRFMFDLIVESLRNRGFKELRTRQSE